MRRSDPRPQVNVKGNPEDDVNSSSFEGIKELQLAGTVPFKDYIDRTVKAKGTLFQAVTGHHYTDVLLNVTGFE